jgi:tetratricopeptide (TPR) repeat protein
MEVSMRVPLVLCSTIVFSATAAAQGDDYRTLNDCMAGEYQTSVEACTRLIEGGGHGADHAANLYTLRGYAHAQTGNDGKAIEDFDKAIELAPRSFGTYQLRGLISYTLRGYQHVQAADRDRAIAYFDKAIELAPHSFTYALRAHFHQSVGQHDRVKADRDEALAAMFKEARQPVGDPIQNYCSATGLQIFGSQLAAVSGYTSAINRNPRLAAAYVMRGEAYVALRELQKAMADFNKAIELDPDYSAAYFRRAATYQLDGKLDKAFADWDKAIGLDPGYSNAYRRRGTALLKQGKHAEALADLDKAIELRPIYPEAYVNRGLTYYEAAQLDRAIADFGKAIEINPRYALAYGNRARTYEKKGDFKRAIAD